MAACKPGKLTREKHEDTEYVYVFGGIHYPGIKSEIAIGYIVLWGLVLFQGGLVLLLGGAGGSAENILLVFCYVILLLFPGHVRAEYEMRFRFTKDGICKISRHVRERIYSWDTILRIELRYPKGRTPANYNCCTAICFIRETNPKSIYYRFWGKNKEFQVEYSPETLEQVKELSSLEIIDKRK